MCSTTQTNFLIERGRISLVTHPCSPAAQRATTEADFDLARVRVCFLSSAFLWFLACGGGRIYTAQRHDVNLLCARHSLHEVHIDKFDQLDDMLVASLKAS